MVYKAKFSFEPVIGKIYHLYYGKEGNVFLSLIEPKEWNREHIGSFKYNHDNKWINMFYKLKYKLLKYILLKLKK